MEELTPVEENGELPTGRDVETDEDGSIYDSECESDENNDGDIEEDDDNDSVDEHVQHEGKENDELNADKSSKGAKKSPTTKKRKRKRKDMTKRRHIRQILDESQLEKETLNAQLEEKERLRRLELQKSIATEGHSAPSASNAANTIPPTTTTPSDTQSPQTPMVVDLRQKSKQQSQVIVIDSDEDMGSQNQLDIEVISSGSDSGDDFTSESDTDASDIDENNVGLHSDDVFNVPSPDGTVLVNTDHPLSEDDIFLAPQIAKCVKPHQIGGIRFLYDNLVETMARYKVSAGFGCILAHSMGLGKTLQVIAFSDIFLRHTPGSKVLIVVPINTIQNWMVEFDMWLSRRPETVGQEQEKTEYSGQIRYRNFDVFLLGDNYKTTLARAKVIGLWKQNGGVMLMGYELYRILAMSTPCMASNKCAPPKKKKTSVNSASNHEPEVIDLEEEEKNMDFLIGIQRALCNPGPDLVICDEGHRIKNNQANISQSLKKIRTKRRVVLTGYPLQNNLVEYWCMVDFVRPNFLGTRQEFCNMFERPILNGQCSDSTPSDVKLMRYRAHVLHSLLEGFVQRRSQSVLKKCLPFKEEHIILIKLSDIQSQLYHSYINYLLESAGHLNPIKGFHTCTKIWNHPDVFFSLLDPKKYGQRNESPLTLLDNEIDDAANAASSVPQESAPNTASTPPQPPEQPLTTVAASLAWAKDIMKDYKPFIAEHGGKVVILMETIKESLQLGEKVLVFSQSLTTLGVIEDFLSRQDIPYFPGRPTDNDPTKWARNKSYFRLDGSTPSLERDRLINAFNSPDNNEVLLFMLSTRAGCLGVNLIGASRVVVFDASWNPCHDVQAVCRVYRYGQKKATHIYRLVSTGTMEKKIYDRQVSKQGVANRVVDELNPEANFTKQEIMSLICEKEPDVQADDVALAASNFSDPVLNTLCKNHCNWLSKVPFKHESLLVDRKELKLTKTEKREAKKGYEREKNMAQQGSRYYVNPVPESLRVTSTSCPYGSSTRPIGTANPLPPLQPRMAAPQRIQPQAFSPFFLQNLIGSNVRFASLSHNLTHDQLARFMPNVSTTVAANILANQMQINRALTAAANMTPSNGSPIACRLPNPSGLPLEQLQAGPNFLTPSNNSRTALMGLNISTPPSVPTTSSLLGDSWTKEVVTIDLDDLPSPPLVDSVQNTRPESNCALETSNARHDDISTSHVINPMECDTIEPSVSPLPTMISNYPGAMVNAEPSTVAVETKDTPQVHASATFYKGSGADAVTMETELSNNVDNTTEGANNGVMQPVSMVTITTQALGTTPTLPLAVLQNLFNEQDGLDARPRPPEESPHSPTGASQI